jgi:hypothetical protein
MGHFGKLNAHRSGHSGVAKCPKLFFLPFPMICNQMVPAKYHRKTKKIISFFAVVLYIV